MLVLTRRTNEKIIINGELIIHITVQNGKVKMAFDGDLDKYIIDRLELHKKKK